MWSEGLGTSSPHFSPSNGQTENVGLSYFVDTRYMKQHSRRIPRLCTSRPLDKREINILLLWNKVYFCSCYLYLSIYPNTLVVTSASHRKYFTDRLIDSLLLLHHTFLSRAYAFKLCFSQLLKHDKQRFSYNLFSNVLHIRICMSYSCLD
jgi:hypothetical protein